MKYLKGFNESISKSIIDDIRELYIEFRDEWGFTETKNVHNPGDNGCTYKFKPDGLSPFFIRMSFDIGSQDVERCYNSLKEMCSRILSLDSEIMVYHNKSYSDIGNLFLLVDVSVIRGKSK